MDALEKRAAAAHQQMNSGIKISETIVWKALAAPFFEE
jgi:hypothetical protein